MTSNTTDLKLIQIFNLMALVFTFVVSPLQAEAQNKKLVKIVFDAKETKKKSGQQATNKYGPQRIPASLQASPRQGNIVPIYDYVDDVEELAAPEAAILPKNKKALADDVEISRDMIIAN